jgi:hypothetical protein
MLRRPHSGRLEARKTLQLHPVVAPHVSHFLQVPFCTSVMF